VSGLRDEATSAAFGIGWSAVKRMPESSARSLFRSLADRAYARDGAGVRQLRRNLARVRPDATPAELEDLVRAGMRSYFRYWVEAFRLPGVPPERIVATHRIIGDEHIVNALAARRGLVIALPHMGNWDHAGAWATLTHETLTTVAERLKPESLYERFLDYRRSLGMEILPLTGGERPVYETLADRCRAGRFICLLADRDLSRSGVPVTLFGHEARVPAGPAALAVDTGAALLPAALWFEDGVSVTRVGPPITPAGDGDRGARVAATTQALLDRLAEGIAEHPEHWHMLQPLWTDDLDAGRLARLRGDAS
jgi:phosphatidylinositol dimannoside acyltransferase